MMRRGLLWLLCGTAAVSAVSLWAPQKAHTIVQAVESRRAPEAVTVPLADARSRAPLPEALARASVEPARRDPFADSVPPSPLLAAAVPAAAAPPAPLAAPVAAPPPLLWRLLGTLSDPQGQRLVVLVSSSATEEKSVVAAPGARLDGGYEVVAVGDESVRLVYPPLQTEVVIPIPPPQAPDR
jgi:hypothetical protein